jgi:uncharacterized RDD family membrane protein YckC
VNCPACRGPVAPGGDRCPSCGVAFAPPVEGALAPDPRSRVEPLREIPGLRKKERTWKDEVRDRVRDRRLQRSGGRDLPLFEQEDVSPAAEEAGEDEMPVAESVEEAPPRVIERAAPPVEVEPPDDLPLRAPEPPLRAAVVAELPEPARPAFRGMPEEPPADEWSLGPGPVEEAAPVERPARWEERLQAGLVDFVLLAGLWAVVIYFAGRAAHVGMAGLWPAWPYLAGFLAFLGLLYATYFTGSTGQTLGKRLTGLQVVDADGRPPGWRKALVRAVVGTAGILLAGSTLFPIFVDPARRGFHDRLLKTRVVKN